jgi:phospholipid N-methyltransferase
MHQRWVDYRVFWREFRQAYHSTGAVLPSGPALAKALCRYVSERDDTERAGARRILEVGPGTGAVTGRIVEAMRADDRLVLVERNAHFIERLRARMTDEPILRRAAGQIELVHASVEELAEDEPFDLIISGLPLNNFSAEVVEQILAQLRRLLSPGGTLSFFEYVGIRRAKALVSLRDRERLRAVGRVMQEVVRPNEFHCDLVLVNVPPAWVHHLRWD